MKQVPCTHTYMHPLNFHTHSFSLSLPPFSPSFLPQRWWFLSFLLFFYTFPYSIILLCSPKCVILHYISLTSLLWRALHDWSCNLIFLCHTSSFLLSFVFFWFMPFSLCSCISCLLVGYLLYVIRLVSFV